MSVLICSFEGCGREHYAKGLCNGHWQQVRYGMELKPLILRGRDKTCVFTGCGRVRQNKDYCQSHVAQRRKGDALRPIQLRSSQIGLVCCISDCDGAALTGGFCSTHRAYSRHGLDAQRANELHGKYECGICGSDNGGRTFHIDHDHGHCAGSYGCSICVRGLLCISCNNGLGMFQDSIATMQSAICYLENNAPTSA